MNLTPANSLAPELGMYGGMSVADVCALSANLCDAIYLDPALASDAGVPELVAEVDSFVASARGQGADIVKLGLARDSIARAVAVSARWYGSESGCSHCRATDDELAVVLAANKGNRKRAALVLSISPITVIHRIKNAGGDSPLAPYKKIKGNCWNSRRARVSDETLAFALARHKGHRIKAGAETGLDQSWVVLRILNSKPDSPLYPFREIKAHYPLRVSDADIAAALEKCKWSLTNAAMEVGLHWATIGCRIQKAEEGSPLARFRDKSGDREKRTRLALLKHDGDIKAAARELEQAPSTIRERIATSAPDSSLREFAVIHHSDSEIAELLARFSGNRTEIARIIGLSLSAVSRRISRCKPDSPLERFRNLSGKTRMEHRYSDRALAIGLAIAFGLDREDFIRLTADALEMGYSTLCGRIYIAPGNSPLHVFGPRRDRHISEKRAAAVLKRSGGDIAKAAETLKIPVKSLKAWIQTSGDDSPLAAYRYRTGRKVRVAIDRIADALDAAHGDVDAAADAVGLGAVYIRQLISMAADGSRLAGFRAPVSLPRHRTDISEGALAAALERNRGNRTATSEEIKMSDTGIGARIRGAGPDSPLAKFKTLKGIPSRVGDDALALALERNGGNRSSTAREVGILVSNIVDRLRRSRPGSKLWPYRSMDVRRRSG